MGCLEAAWDKFWQIISSWKCLLFLIALALGSAGVLYCVNCDNELGSILASFFFLFFGTLSSCSLYKRLNNYLSQIDSDKKEGDCKSQAKTGRWHDRFLLLHLLIGNGIYFFLYYLSWNCLEADLDKFLFEGEALLSHYRSDPNLIDVLAYTIKTGDGLGIGDISPIGIKLKALTTGQIIFNLIDIGVIVLSFGARGNFLVHKGDGGGSNRGNNDDEGSPGAVLEKEIKELKKQTRTLSKNVSIQSELISRLEEYESEVIEKYDPSVYFNADRAYIVRGQIRGQVRREILSYFKEVEDTLNKYSSLDPDREKHLEKLKEKLLEEGTFEARDIAVRFIDTIQKVLNESSK